MTTEEDAFQKAIDAAEDDYTRNLARCVFADWLEERDDPRATGYRCLAACNRDVNYWKEYGECECPYWYGCEIGLSGSSHYLPRDWFDAIRFHGKVWREGGGCCPDWGENHNATRRELDDAAALAVALLPVERVEMLLAGVLFEEVAA